MKNPESKNSITENLESAKKEGNALSQEDEEKNIPIRELHRSPDGGGNVRRGGETIAKIKDKLINPRAISREHDIEGRKSKAAEIIDARKEIRHPSDLITKNEKMILQAEKKIADLDGSYKEKISRLKQRSEEPIVRFKKFFGIKDKEVKNLQTDIGLLRHEKRWLSDNIDDYRGNIEIFESELKRLPDPRKMLEAYYKSMETIPLTNREKREFLKPEVLAELNNEEYIKLWRRLNPYFLTHIVRQGFRDHLGMPSHQVGFLKFNSGFIEVLKDGKILRPQIATMGGLRVRNEASVKKLLERWVLKADNKKEARNRLETELNFSIAYAPKYPDMTAVHFAVQNVLDNFYGGERGNETFFLYPTDVLASQYNYAFNDVAMHDFILRGQDGRGPGNDTFIWPSSLDNPGIPIDSGLVFLPKDTPVDPETGSKYASEIKVINGEKKRVMIEDKKLITSFIKWMDSLNSESSLIRAYKEFQKDRSNEAKGRIFDNMFSNEILKIGFHKDDVEAVRRELWWFPDCVSEGWEGCDLGENPKEAAKKEAIKRLKSETGVLCKRPKNAVTAKIYWEKYFKENPQLKPRHLVFYNGDPTKAVYEFLIKHNIGQADVSKKEGKLLGFEDKHIEKMWSDPRANPGYDELEKMSNKIIDEYYSGRGE